MGGIGWFVNLLSSLNVWLFLMSIIPACDLSLFLSYSFKMFISVVMTENIWFSGPFQIEDFFVCLNRKKKKGLTLGADLKACMQ